VVGLQRCCSSPEDQKKIDSHAGIERQEAISKSADRRSMTSMTGHESRNESAPMHQRGRQEFVIKFP
jgi:hypothetical protein